MRRRSAPPPDQDLDQLARRLERLEKTIVPVGGVILWWGLESDIPDGYEVCDGRKPVTHGATLTTPKPDLRGRFPAGTDRASSFRPWQANSGGSTSIAMRTEPAALTEVVKHDHGIGSHTHSLHNHTHDLHDHTHDLASHTHDLASHTHDLASHTHDLADHTHDLGNHTHDLGNHRHTIPGSFQTISYATGGNSVKVLVNSGSTTTDGPSTNDSGTPSKNTSGTPSRNTSGTPSKNTSGTPSKNISGTPSKNTSGTPSKPDSGTPSPTDSGPAVPPHSRSDPAGETGPTHDHAIQIKDTRPPYTEFIFIIRVK